MGKVALKDRKQRNYKLKQQQRTTNNEQQHQHKPSYSSRRHNRPLYYCTVELTVCFRERLINQTTPPEADATTVELQVPDATGLERGFDGALDDNKLDGCEVEPA